MGRDEVIFYARLCARLAHAHTDREGMLDFHGLDANGFDRLERRVLDALAREPSPGALSLAFAEGFAAARGALLQGPPSDDDSLSTARWPGDVTHSFDALDTVDGSEQPGAEPAALLDVMETLHSPGNKRRS